LRRADQRFESLVFQGVVRIVIDDMRAPEFVERQLESFPPGKNLSLFHGAGSLTKTQTEVQGKPKSLTARYHRWQK
jgi:hypothetical protein